jgi:hypothetical protein
MWRQDGEVRPATCVALGSATSTRALSGVQAEEPLRLARETALEPSPEPTVVRPLLIGHEHTVLKIEEEQTKAPQTGGS